MQPIEIWVASVYSAATHTAGIIHAFQQSSFKFAYEKVTRYLNSHLAPLQLNISQVVDKTSSKKKVFSNVI